MIKKLLALTLLLTACSTAAPYDGYTGNQFSGTLVDNVEVPPDCGVFAYSLVLKFDIDGDPLLLELFCPRIYGESFFTKGVEYQFVIAETPFETTTIQYNEYEDEDALPIFWAESIHRPLSLPIPPAQNLQ